MIYDNKLDKLAFHLQKKQPPVFQPRVLDFFDLLQQLTTLHRQDHGYSSYERLGA